MFRHALQSLVLFSLLSFVNSGATVAQEFNELTLVQLEKQLNAILKTRLPEERSYISALIKLVDEDKVPRKLLNVSFKYVTNRRAFAKNRFVYFVRVLQFLGEREKVAIPKFDFTIYSVRR